MSADSESGSLLASRPKHPCPGGEPDCNTAQALLYNATGLFADRGYEGTSIRAITDASQANLAAVTYHFGSKRGLYVAVLESLLGPIGEGIREAFEHDGTPLERIREVVAALVLYMGRNPEQPRLMLQEITSVPLLDPVVQRAMRENLGMLQSLVKEGQADGSIRPGDPLLMSLSLISQPVHMSVILHPLRSVLDLQEEPEDLLERMASHAADFAVRALEARKEIAQ
jgi:AcrR family transcriptional regulator